MSEPCRLITSGRSPAAAAAIAPLGIAQWAWISVALVLARDAAHHPDARTIRERRRRVGRPLHRDIRPEGAGVTEDVQGRNRRVAVEVVVDSVFHLAASHQGMPRRDDMDRMPAC